MSKDTFKSLIRRLLAAVLLCLCFVMCCCDESKWCIHEEYSDEEMETIYSYISNKMLFESSSIVAKISFKEDGLRYEYNLLMYEYDKYAVKYDAYSDGKPIQRVMYYNKYMQQWDVAKLDKEVHWPVERFPIDFLMDDIVNVVDFLHDYVINIMSYTDDSYCYRCAPSNYGVAQINYLPTDSNLSISASWTVEDLSKKDLPPVREATFYYSDSDSEKEIVFTLFSSSYNFYERVDGLEEAFNQDIRRDIENTEQEQKAE